MRDNETIIGCLLYRKENEEPIRRTHDVASIRDTDKVCIVVQKIAIACGKALRREVFGVHHKSFMSSGEEASPYAQPKISYRDYACNI